MEKDSFIFASHENQWRLKERRITGWEIGELLLWIACHILGFLIPIL
jgi:hypothetical protein